MTTIASVAAMQKELEMSWSKIFEGFEQRLEAVATQSNPSLVQLSEDFHSFKSLVSKMFGLLRQQISECSKIVDNMDMRQRQKTLLFNGIEENAESNIEGAVLTVIQDKLGYSHITSSSIKRCHRLGVATEGRARPILVQFRDYKTKAEIWKSKARLKGSAISISEFLTRIRQAVYKQARNSFGMGNVWTLDGVIYVKTQNAGRHKVVTGEDLEALIAKESLAISPAGSGSSNEASGSSGKGAGRVLPKAAVTSNAQAGTRSKQSGAVMHMEESKRPRRPVLKK